MARNFKLKLGHVRQQKIALGIQRGRRRLRGLMFGFQIFRALSLLSQVFLMPRHMRLHLGLQFFYMSLQQVLFILGLCFLGFGLLLSLGQLRGHCVHLRVSFEPRIAIRINIRFGQLWQGAGL